MAFQHLQSSQDAPTALPQAPDHPLIDGTDENSGEHFVLYHTAVNAACAFLYLSHRFSQKATPLMYMST
jgi:hypothetical protein